MESLEDENRRLKQLVADLSLDKEASKAIVRTKRVEFAGLRVDAAFAMKEFAMSERPDSRLVELDCSSYRCEPRADQNAELREELLKFGAAEIALRMSASACAVT